MSVAFNTIYFSDKCSIESNGWVLCLHRKLAASALGISPPAIDKIEIWPQTIRIGLSNLQERGWRDRIGRSSAPEKCEHLLLRFNLATNRRALPKNLEGCIEN